MRPLTFIALFGAMVLPAGYLIFNSSSPAGNQTGPEITQNDTTPTTPKKITTTRPVHAAYTAPQPSTRSRTS